MGQEKNSKMKHVKIKLIDLPWYMAPYTWSEDGMEMLSGNFTMKLGNEYEFWMISEKKGFVKLIREYKGGGVLSMEIIKEKFSIEDFE
jgi:hypothetical protein